MRVHAATTDGHALSFVVADPPTPEDWARWAALASMPGMADASWWGAPDTGVRGNPHPAAPAG